MADLTTVSISQDAAWRDPAYWQTPSGSTGPTETGPASTGGTTEPTTADASQDAAWRDPAYWQTSSGSTGPTEAAPQVTAEHGHANSWHMPPAHVDWHALATHIAAHHEPMGHWFL